MSAQGVDYEEVASREGAFDEVVVMENDSKTEAYIIDALEALGLKPRTVESAEEAVEYAKKRNARSYILDVNMGSERNQEGLQALTRIKKHDKSIFVAVYSNLPDKLQMARKAGADACREKSGDHFVDVVNIVSLMAPPALRGMVEKFWKTLGHTSEPPDKPDPPEKTDLDVNRHKYRELRSDPHWLKEHYGYFIAIVNGELEDEDTDRKKLLGRVREDHSGKPIFVTEVEENEELVRILSPLRFNDL